MLCPIYFHRVVAFLSAWSLIKPLAPHIVAKMHQAKVVEGRESAGPTAYVEFNSKSVLGLHPGRLGFVRQDHSLQLVIDVPSHLSFPKQAPSVEPTSLAFQPYMASSRHGDWLPRINVPVRCSLPKKLALQLKSLSRRADGVVNESSTQLTKSKMEDEPGKLKARDVGAVRGHEGIGNPYATPSAASTSRASQISERRLKKSASRANTVRLLNTNGNLIMPMYHPACASAQTERAGGQPGCLAWNASARSNISSGRALSPTSRPAPPREKYWPREFVASEMFVERIEGRGAEKRRSQDAAKARDAGL